MSNVTGRLSDGQITSTKARTFAELTNYNRVVPVTGAALSIGR
jgi:hypothetical protein